jgi:mono/diheme cytochrome c family protein
MMDDPQRRAVARELPEPEEGRNPWPYAVWLFFGVMLGWGATYLGLQAGDGDAAFGDHRTPTIEAATTVAAKADGAVVFQNICIACHQKTGLGIAGAFPPLAGSQWLEGNASIPARIILHGLAGPIEVKGVTYNGVMPAFGAQLSDEEIAAVVSYVRSQWGNSAPAISAAEVKALRDGLAQRTAPWSAAELKAP